MEGVWDDLPESAAATPAAGAAAGAAAAAAALGAGVLGALAREEGAVEAGEPGVTGDTAPLPLLEAGEEALSGERGMGEGTGEAGPWGWRGWTVDGDEREEAGGREARRRGGVFKSFLTN